MPVILYRPPCVERRSQGYARWRNSLRTVNVIIETSLNENDFVISMLLVRFEQTIERLWIEPHWWSCDVMRVKVAEILVPHWKEEAAILGKNCSCLLVLTHWRRVTHICVNELIIIVSDKMACRLYGAKPLSEPMIVIWTIRNKLQWNLNQYAKLFVPEKKSFVKVVCEMGHFLQGGMS